LAEITGTSPVEVAAEVGVRAPVLAPPAAKGALNIRREPYRGWKDAVIMDNGQAEVVIVPAVGRVMQFRFRNGEPTFWENEALLGKLPDPESGEWGNFGGDKTWPAPQADWPKLTPRAWPPPVAFDSMAVTAQINEAHVTLISPVDPHYGIRTYRMIALEPDRPVMKITTRYEKVIGDPVSVSVWIITQLRDPAGVYVPVPAPTLFPSGYHAMSRDLPPDLKYSKGLISLTRPRDKSTKIGTDAGSLLWIGRETMMRMDSPRDGRRRYPDNSSSAEVYTNPDPNAYVELEMLSPLKLLEVGQTMEETCLYTLIPRRLADPEKEARQVLGR
ncbi:MAG TPA: hypothetical protein DCY13_25030, partial [Verrucomicrobiales bacterium]|nr:hypothetical protein [Verrucomicrobiales bacterium]